jgi:hypothetical protein
MTLGNCFRKGCWFILAKWEKHSLGVDWTCLEMQDIFGGNITLQNFDPSRLLSP